MREYGFQEPAAAATRFCADCGAQINPRAEICPKCGVRQYQPNIKPSRPEQRYQPKRIVAGLLGLFLITGMFGLHKFYMGQAGKGLLYCCFFWTFIPAIFAFFQGIGYLLMSDEDFEERYWH